jgi:hypothetical protein
MVPPSKLPILFFDWDKIAAGSMGANIRVAGAVGDSVVRHLGGIVWRETVEMIPALGVGWKI